MNKNITSMVVSLVIALPAAAAEHTDALAVGQTIPALMLKSASGDSLSLQEAAREQPLILIFYRGGWCPYCNRHLSELQKLDPQLRELGYRILAISPDLPANLNASIDKNELTYTLLSDSNMEAAKAFGLAFTVDDATLEKYAGYGIDLESASGEKHHMLPVPAVFLVGQDGIVDFVYADPDYKIRIDPDDLITAAKTRQ